MDVRSVSDASTRAMDLGVRAAQTGVTTGKTIDPSKVGREDQGTNEQRKVVTKVDLEKAVDVVNQLMLPHHTDLHFVLHEKLNRYYVQVIDSTTDQVVREIPPKKFLDAQAAMLDLFGFLVDEKV
ncbi:flagellar protein FlaG [Camelliibacillus cellulosilyticus]|uniref:Flagellar protein FlaG n=1 Tax=Camelliibacillus cellulosilyticus TaxID=2174486 RepID=A0ABV9GMP7_9BACL